MVDDIEEKVLALAKRHDGFYLFKNRTLMPESSIYFDLQLDRDEAEDLMNDFFTELKVHRGTFDIENYYPDFPVSFNPFKKKIIDIPDFTLGMLIASAKAGRWIYS